MRAPVRSRSRGSPFAENATQPASRAGGIDRGFSGFRNILFCLLVSFSFIVFSTNFPFFLLFGFTFSCFPFSLKKVSRILKIVHCFPKNSPKLLKHVYNF